MTFGDVTSWDVTSWDVIPDYNGQPYCLQKHIESSPSDIAETTQIKMAFTVNQVTMLRMNLSLAFCPIEIIIQSKMNHLNHNNISNLLIDSNSYDY